jgi:biotin synthase
MHPSIEQAYRILEDGQPITRDLALALGQLGGDETLDLVSLANKVRNRYATDIEACSIVNSRSGVCGENCKFCAQSTHHEAEVDRYGLITESALLAEARAAHAENASHFGIVTSGYGYPSPTPDFERICSMIGRIHEELPDMDVCVSLGILGEETAEMLSQCKITHYNINLQVAPQRYAELIADTHTVEDRIATIKLLRQNGITVCSGAILGVGETMDDRVDLAYALHELDVSVIPLNVLIPIEGTPLADREPLSVVDVAKSFALFRLIHPRKVIKFAAGRETLMKDFQGLLMLAGMNGILTGGYLTTRGRQPAEDRDFIAQLDGFRQ